MYPLLPSRPHRASVELLPRKRILIAANVAGAPYLSPPWRFHLPESPGSVANRYYLARHWQGLVEVQESV